MKFRNKINYKLAVDKWRNKLKNHHRAISKEKQFVKQFSDKYPRIFRFIWNSMTKGRFKLFKAFRFNVTSATVFCLSKEHRSSNLAASKVKSGHATRMIHRGTTSHWNKSKIPRDPSKFLFHLPRTFAEDANNVSSHRGSTHRLSKCTNLHNNSLRSRTVCFDVYPFHTVPDVLEG